MLPILIVMAAAALGPLGGGLQADAACVVAIARAAPHDPGLDRPGREFAALVGADIMDGSGRTREEARDVFAAALRAPRPDLATCKRRMGERLAEAELPAPSK